MIVMFILQPGEWNPVWRVNTGGSVNVDDSYVYTSSNFRATEDPCFAKYACDEGFECAGTFEGPDIQDNCAIQYLNGAMVDENERRVDPSVNEASIVRKLLVPDVAASVAQREQYGLPDEAQMNSIIDENQILNRNKRNTGGSITIPSTFDLRKHLKCGELVNHIRQQGECSNCWATAAVKVAGDSLCMASSGKFKQLLSPTDLKNCACNAPGNYNTDETVCQSSNNYDRCLSGGVLSNALKTINKKGLANGGDSNFYNPFSSTCIPYSILGTGDDHLGNTKKTFNTRGECSSTCQAGGFKEKYAQSAHMSIKAFDPSNKNAIKSHIMLHGPVAFNMDAFNSLSHYASGVYKQENTVKKSSTRHSMVAIGWGQENGEDYWQVANSWGAFYGDRGFLKMKMDTSGMATGNWFGALWNCGKDREVNAQGKCVTKSGRKKRSLIAEYLYNDVDTCSHEFEKEIVITENVDDRFRTRNCRTESSTLFSSIIIYNQYGSQITVASLDSEGQPVGGNFFIANGVEYAISTTTAQAYLVSSSTGENLFLFKVLRSRSQTLTIDVKKGSITGSDGSDAYDYTSLNAQTTADFEWSTRNAFERNVLSSDSPTGGFSIRKRDTTQNRADDWFEEPTNAQISSCSPLSKYAQVFKDTATLLNSEKCISTAKTDNNFVFVKNKYKATIESCILKRKTVSDCVEIKATSTAFARVNGWPGARLLVREKLTGTNIMIFAINKDVSAEFKVFKFSVRSDRKHQTLVQKKPSSSEARTKIGGTKASLSSARQLGTILLLLLVGLLL